VTEPVSDVSTTQPECSVPKKLRSSTGVLHDKLLCVWCINKRSE